MLNSLTIIERIASTTLKLINGTRQKVMNKTLFKTENIKAISLAFQKDGNFTTIYRPLLTLFAILSLFEWTSYDGTIMRIGVTWKKIFYKSHLNSAWP